MLSERRWDALLVDHSIGAETVAIFVGVVGEAIARRIVLITPAERHRLPALKDAGFTGYLVKPVRAASLQARLMADPSPAGDAFEHSGAPVEASDIPLAADGRRRRHARFRSWSPRTTRSTRC